MRVPARRLQPPYRRMYVRLLPEFLDRITHFPKDRSSMRDLRIRQDDVFAIRPLDPSIDRHARIQRPLLDRELDQFDHESKVRVHHDRPRGLGGRSVVDHDDLEIVALVAVISIVLRKGEQAVAKGLRALPEGEHNRYFPWDDVQSTLSTNATICPAT